MDIIFTIAFHETLSQSESGFTIRAIGADFMAPVGNIAFSDNLHHFKKVFIAANNTCNLDYGIPDALDSII